MTDTDDEKLEAAVVADLATRGRLNEVTRAQARQYVQAIREADRLSAAVAELPPGSAAHKRASTALGRAQRARDTAARHLGQTETSRKLDNVKKTTNGPGLIELCATAVEQDRRAVAGELPFTFEDVNGAHEVRTLDEYAALLSGHSGRTPAEEKAKLLHDAERSKLSELEQARDDAYVIATAERMSLDVDAYLRRISPGLFT